MGLLNFIKRKVKREPRKKDPAAHPPKIKVGLAFGAGGTRGFAHIGAIRAFEECGIDFPLVTGCSVGSIAAAMYCFGLTSYEIEEAMLKVQYRDIRNSPILFIPSNSKNIESLIRNVIGEATFEQLSKPFALTAVDIKTGEEIVINYGDIAKACSASCAVPGIFTPVEFGEYRLVDGGLMNPIPADVLRVMGAEAVVSIDIHSGRGGGTQSTKSLDMLMACFHIGMKSSAIKGIVNTDVIIQPDCQQYKQTKLENAHEMIAEGYRATMAKMDDIRALMGLPIEKRLLKSAQIQKNKEN